MPVVHLNGFDSLIGADDSSVVEKNVDGSGLGHNLLDHILPGRLIGHVMSNEVNLVALELVIQADIQNVDNRTLLGKQVCCSPTDAPGSSSDDCHLVC